MAKTNDIIQAKEQSYMKETPESALENSTELTDTESVKKTTTDAKFKEAVCPKVPTSYFKRAKKQKNQY